MPAKRADENTIALGRTIKRLREAKEWTQADVARRLTERVGRPIPIDQSLIARMEAGKRVTSATDIAALADVFDVPGHVLLSGTNPLWQPEDWAEWATWEARAMLDAARSRLEDAARAYGQVRAGFESQDAPEEHAAAIAERFEAEGWNDEVSRQNV
jgi:transcriptional regulator with XRE-family HTH domain